MLTSKAAIPSTNRGEISILRTIPTSGNDMKHIQTDAYQQALAQASKAFMVAMGQQGYAVRDYPENFIEALRSQTQLAFEPNARAQRSGVMGDEGVRKAKVTRLPVRGVGRARVAA